MKQTNNAIKFLMAQYRAVFKHAYLKGIASAVLLTAGLAAAGSAQAAAMSNLEGLASGDITINGQGNTEYLNISLSSGATWNGTLTIEAGTADTGSSGNRILGKGSGNLQLSGSGTLVIETDAVTNGLLLQSRGSAAGDGLSVNIQGINVISGKLAVSDKKGSNSGSVTIAADSISVGGDGIDETSGATASISLAATGGAATGITLGRSNVDGFVDSTINVADGGVVLMSTTTANDWTKIVGESLNVQADGLVVTSGAGTNTLASTRTLIEADGGMVVQGPTTITSHETTINGNLLIDSNGKLTLNPKDADTNNDDDPEAGTVTIGSGANVQIAGQIRIEANTDTTEDPNGNLIIEDGATLVATVDGSSTSGRIAVIGDTNITATNGYKNDGPRVTIGSSTLKNFLNGGVKYQALSYDSGNQTLNTADTDSDAKKGALSLANGGILKFNDESRVTLNDFYFVSGASAVSGSIQINENGGIVMGHDLTITDTLNKDATTDVEANLKLYIEADNLTLGSSTYSGTDSLGFEEARVKDNLNLVGSGGTFTLADEVILNREFFTQTTGQDGVNEINTTTLNGNGTITGSDIVIGDSSSGSLTVNGGAWQSASDITVTSGSLSVVATTASDEDSNDYYTNDGNPASLTLTGIVTINGSTSNDNAKIEVTGASGADATLDLTNANLEFNATKSGSITVSGAAIAWNAFDTAEANNYYSEHNVDGKVGYGKLLLNSRDFSQLLTSTEAANTKLTVGKDGYVYVNGSLTESFEFDDFGTSSTGGDIAFTGSGSILEINGDITITETTSTSPSSPDDTFAIGSGSIWADRITLNTDNKDRDGTINPITVSGGNFKVSHGFSTNTSSLTFDGSSNDSTLTLRTDELQDVGTVRMGSNGLLSLKGGTSGASLSVERGSWDATGIDLDVSGSTATVTVGDSNLVEQAQALSTDDNTVYVASLTADNFAATDSGKLTVNKQSEAIFNTMQLDGATVNVNGHVLVNGTDAAITDKKDPVYGVNRDKTTNVSTTAGIEFKDSKVTVSGLGAQFEFGEVATAALIQADAEDKDNNDALIIVNKDALSSGTFTLEDFGEVKLNLASSYKLTESDAKYLVNFFNADGTSGYINVGDADLGITFTPDANGNLTVAWDAIDDFAQITAGGVTSNQLKSALVTSINQSSRHPIQGHYGAVQVDASLTTGLRVDGPTSLNNAITAADGNKYFVFRGDYINSTPTTVDVTLVNENASLGLFGGGIVGSINGNNSDVAIAAADNYTTEVRGDINDIDDLDIASNTEVQGDVEANFLELTSSLSTTTQGKSIFVNEADVYNGASIKTSNFVVGSGSTTGYHEVAMMGSLEADSSVTLYGDSTINIYGGTVSTKNLTLKPVGNAVGEVTVGYDVAPTETTDDPNTIYNELTSYTGYLEVTGVTELNGGVLGVDPKYGMPTALVSLNQLSQAPAGNDASIVAGTLDGDVFVGQNAALGIGSASLDTLRSKIARFQNGGISLNPEQVGAVVYLGKTFNVGENQSLILTANSYEGFLEDYNQRNASTATDINSNNLFGVLSNTVYLGDNTALLVDAAVMTRADVKVTGNTNAVINFSGTAGSVLADGGDIVVDGNVRASTYKVFGNATISYIDGTAYAEVTDSTAAHYDDNINVSTENDFLQGVVKADGTVTLGVNPNGRAIMHGASDPVYASLVAYAQGYNGAKPTVEEETAHPVDPDSAYTQIAGVADSRLLYSYDAQGHKTYTYNNYFLQETISTGDGSAAETVARLGVFGGAAQAAIAAGSSTYDAISGRMGVGANGSNITVADNAQGAALWLAPIYKTSDSDSFDAEGVDYGVDLNLYGVALGADYTLSNGMRFGAMFNVGSGDVDGQGAGSNVSNDFDYYGFAVYGGYTMGALSLVADVSYTVADNDLEGNTSIDKVGASLDSTNLSLGVTGAYQLDVGGMSITPHAGLRFSQIELDDYTVDGAHDIAHYDADSMNIFSIPVGVTFAKEFQGEAWTVKPSFDVTLTGNFGDNETDGTVTWAGVENLATDVSSEVLDDFTYGATLGVAAKTGNFSLGLGVNYTGSSNVDEFGVQANARFVF